MSHRYTFRLKPGRDQDLISWLDSLGEGERSFFIRNTLRKAIVVDGNVLEFNHKNSPVPIEVTPKITEDVIIQKEIMDESSSIENKFNKLADIF